MGRARVVATRLAEEYPGTAAELCALQFETPFQLLTATILSAQTTDVRVNMVTPALFAAYPDAAALARADPERVEEIIRSTGFFRAKTRSIIGMAAALEERFGGQVPTELADLVTVPGVGRKTGNVVRSVAFGLPGLPVDTHVLRVSKRLGLTELEDPVKVELALNALIPPCRAGRLQPPGDPARAGDLYGPPACLFSLHPGRHLPVGLPGSQLGIQQVWSICRTIGKGSRLQCSAEPVPATWFRKGSSLGSASRTTRRCRPFGVGIGNSQPSPFFLASQVLLLVLPNANQVLPFFPW